MLHWAGCVDAHVCPDGGAAKQPSQSKKTQVSDFFNAPVIENETCTKTKPLREEWSVPLQR